MYFTSDISVFVVVYLRANAFHFWLLFILSLLMYLQKRLNLRSLNQYQLLKLQSFIHVYMRVSDTKYMCEVVCVHCSCECGIIRVCELARPHACVYLCV